MSDTIDQELVNAAVQARQNAYAPYSNFAVGAAIRDSEGNIHVGVNVENAAYPHGQCAEASAIGAMVTAGGKQISAVAVAGDGDALCTPCGGCRQRIREFSNAKTVVHICGPDGHRKSFSFNELLPASFGPENLY